MKVTTLATEIWRTFHEALVMDFILTNLLSASQMRGFQKLITDISEKPLTKFHKTVL